MPYKIKQRTVQEVNQINEFLETRDRINSFDYFRQTCPKIVEENLDKLTIQSIENPVLYMDKQVKGFR